MNPLTATVRTAARALEPPPKLLPSEWADRHRYLTASSTSETGPWRTARVPYLREIMDSAADPKVEKIVLMKPTQIGATEMLLCLAGYYMHARPSPILYVIDTLDKAEELSKDRLAPMIASSPALRGLVAPVRARDSGNTLLKKNFPNGVLTLVGANSPSGITSKPVRILILDETDRYPPSSGGEGDPIKLAERRTQTFHDRKHILASSPTTRNFSHIESEFLQSDRRYYHVPCLACGHYARLQWANVRWPDGAPEKACYRCPHCGHETGDGAKPEMLSRGKWIAEGEFGGTAGFHLSSLYSPWVTFGQMASEFIRSKDHPEKLKTFVNTFLAETWQEAGDSADADDLFTRTEPYPLEPLPAGVLVITAGVDVQEDRIEVQTVGWGLGGESWVLDYQVFHGDPSQPSGWEPVDDCLQRRFGHPSGLQLPVAAAAVDSGGHYTDAVYDFCLARKSRRIWAVRGSSRHFDPVIPPQKAGKRAASPVLTIGVHQAKDILFTRLQKGSPGSGLVHFPDRLEPAYFEQLTAEQRVTRYREGRPAPAWILKKGRRNEALDTLVYAIAAAERLNPQFPVLARKLGRMTPGEGSGPVTAAKNSLPPARQRVNSPKRHRGFVSGWKRRR